MELLVKLVDNTHIDPAKDLRCWKRGDVVVAMEDNHQWGREEGPPKFAIIKMPGVSLDKINNFLTPEMETVEVESKIPFEDLKNQSDLKPRTDGVKNYITVTRMKARRQIAVDVTSVATKVNQGTIPGVIGPDVAVAVMTVNDLNASAITRVGAAPIIDQPVLT